MRYFLLKSVSKQILPIKNPTDICHYLIELIDYHTVMDDCRQLSYLYRICLEQGFYIFRKSRFLRFVFIKIDVDKWQIQIRQKQSNNLTNSLKIKVDQNDFGLRLISSTHHQYLIIIIIKKIFYRKGFLSFTFIFQKQALHQLISQYVAIKQPSIKQRDAINHQFTHGFVTHTIDRNQKIPKVFPFPLSRQGLQTVKNKEDLNNVLRTKFRETYPSQEMPYPYEIGEAKGNNEMRQEEHRLIAHCRICTNNIVYVKKVFGETSYRLVKMGGYHVHGKDPNKVEELRRRTQNHSRWTLRLGRPVEVKPIYIDEKADANIQEFIKSLPVEITNASRCRIVCDRFKITKTQYDNVMRTIRSQYQISLRELFDRFDKKGYSYRYLPQNLIDINQEYIANKKINQYIACIRHYDPQDQKNVHKIDPTNPDLPNVILIITPQMKDLYYKYGQYIGFDLTFSLIQEKPQNTKEYLIGVMAGTSESRRILIYGFVITNNQSEYAYKYIFREFFNIMGKSPETIVTDEQMSLHYALDSLRQEGLFTGKHLLDMFHVLKKFRKSCESTTFQLFRKMMHSKDRQEYRRALNEAMLQVSNDEQLEVLRNFDYNSDRYCYSQTDSSFVGIGISDSMNQKYHDLIKAQLPYETKYIKAVNTILDLIESRNELNRYGIIDKNPLEEKMSMDFMKPYRTVLSDKLFHYLLKEVCKSLPYVILSHRDDRKANLKLEDDIPVTPGLINRDIYAVKTNSGVFTVYRNYEQGEAINEQRRNRGHWKCHCEFEEKSGYLCSHLAKVLLTLGLDFFDNIHPRWILRQEQIEEGMKKYIHRERKFHQYPRIRMRKFPKWVSTEQSGRNGEKRREPTEVDDSENDSLDYESNGDLSSFAGDNVSEMYD